MVSIASSLGIGSGLDTAQLVKDLAATAKAPKEQRIAAREAANKAKVSALGDAASGIDNFSKALSSLISGGTLFTQPTSSDAGAVKVSALPGARLSGLSAEIQVLDVAKPQSLVSAVGVNRGQRFGAGSFTITNAAGKATTVTVPEGDDTIAGIARAITASGAGVTASIVTQGDTAKLVVKGATGAGAGFSIEASGAYAAFGYGAAGDTGMQATQAARDARVVIDGVETTRSSNSITDLIPGVRIELAKATGASPVTIGAASPAAAIRQAVLDFADAYNELKATLDTATASGLGGGEAGPLRSDYGMRELRQQLGRLTSTALASGGSPSTLAEIGVRTGRDGTLSVDTAVLDDMLAKSPEGVEALFNPIQRSSSPLVQITSAMGKTKPGTYEITEIAAGPPPSAKIDGRTAVSIGGVLSALGVTPAAGLSFTVAPGVTSATITVDAGLGGALTAIRDALRSSTGPLTTTSKSLAAEAKALARDREAMELRAAAYEGQLQRSFSKLDSRVNAFKATQAYLEQQVALWTKSDS